MISQNNFCRALRRLGHREDLQRMAQQPEDYELYPLKRLYDWNPELR